MAEPWAVRQDMTAAAVARKPHKVADTELPVVAAAVFPAVLHPAHDFFDSSRPIAEYSDYT